MIDVYCASDRYVVLCLTLMPATGCERSQPSTSAMRHRKTKDDLCWHKECAADCTHSRQAATASCKRLCTAAAVSRPLLAREIERGGETRQHTQPLFCRPLASELFSLTVRQASGHHNQLHINNNSIRSRRRHELKCFASDLIVGEFCYNS